MRINSVKINKILILKYYEKTFFDLGETILNNNHSLDLKIEIELVPFGKFDFLDQEKKNSGRREANKKRLFYFFIFLFYFFISLFLH